MLKDRVQESNDLKRENFYKILKLIIIYNLKMQ